MAEETGLCLVFLETPKTGFLATSISFACQVDEYNHEMDQVVEGKTGC